MRNASGFALKGTLHILISLLSGFDRLRPVRCRASCSVLSPIPLRGRLLERRLLYATMPPSSSREYTTDERGVYFFTFLPPGTYTLSLQSAGFKQYQDTDVRIQVAQVTRIDISMEIGSAKEVLDISGSIEWTKFRECLARHGGGPG